MAKQQDESRNDHPGLTDPAKVQGGRTTPEISEAGGLADEDRARTGGDREGDSNDLVNQGRDPGSRDQVEGTIHASSGSDQKEDLEQDRPAQRDDATGRIP